MNRFSFKNRSSIFTILFGIIIMCSSCGAQTIIPANHEHLYYQGKIDFSKPTEPTFSWPGVSVTMYFQGTQATLTLKDFATGEENTTNFYTVIIDDIESSVLQAKNGINDYIIASNLEPGEHKIEIFRRTESFVGKSAFLGFKIDGSILPLSTIPKKTIEFIGDSWSCGYGNEVSIPAPPEGNPNVGFHSKNEDNYNAFGAITAQRLNTAYICTAYSGRGIYRNFSGATEGTLPKIYNRVFADDQNSEWSQSNYSPNAIIVFLGTNDFAKEQSNNSEMDLDSSKYVNTYTTFINEVSIKHPEAEIVLIHGGSVTDNWPTGKAWATRWKNYVNAVKSNFSKNNKIHVFSFKTQSPPYGEDWHPSKQTHISLADQLTPYIEKLIY